MLSKVRLERKQRGFGPECLKGHGGVGGTWRLIATARGLYSLRVSRFVASRVKRWPLPKPRRGQIRIFVGKVYALLKKGQNARMGKGVGAYFTRRRLILPGFVWLEAAEGYTPSMRHICRYLQVRSGGHVRPVAWGRWTPHLRREAGSRADSIKAWESSDSSKEPRVREFYYRRWRMRLSRS